MHYHKIQGYCVTSEVIVSIRQAFWPIHGHTTVKRVIGRCLACRRRLATARQQLIAPLPLAKVERGWRCFSDVGIDYFGPVLTKRGRSMEKRCGCLFTCLQTGAVHIELVHSMSTDSFIMALMRFIARRGSPEEIFSDNSSNCVRAIGERREHLKSWDQEQINHRLLKQEVQWHFQPPSASHRGGVWEGMVRSARRVLTAIASEQVIPDETLLNFLSEVERILNNRPIVSPRSDVRDKLALSPNMLLLLEENTGIPSHCSYAENFTRKWKHVNYLADVFWKMWMKEYLPTLQIRQKWSLKTRNLKEDDVVLVVSDGVQKERWPLGIVPSCAVCSDGIVRTVSVKTATGTIRRGTRRLCLLEGDEWSVDFLGNLV
ncbi:hypothetical protein CLF_109917 [Clonorchis sinensis]|uniref:DUF5641 domain-containing protein n=1 Tax=Clonorchis sinensis TaxID=79923 RepID=G7YJY6_CLOSI|nr:hypothetical protein CLF_109917 [Clonorchis sinensis]